MSKIQDLASELDRYKHQISDCQYFCDQLKAHKGCDWKWFHVWRDKNTEKGSVNFGSNMTYADTSFPVQELIKINPPLEAAWNNFWGEMINAYSVLRDKTLQDLQNAVQEE